MQADIKQIAGDLYLITLPPPISGFQDFISAWLYRIETPVLVDVGPAATVPALFQALESMQVRDLAYILLTHIHMDHAGGIGEVTERFSRTPVVCHEKAAPHLVDPTRLWKGSVQTLGDRARAYGRIRPVAANRIVLPQALSGSGIRAIMTPGHAPHHVSYHAGKYLFIGETGGVCLPFPEGPDYLRPATPPPFFLETTIASIDLLLQEASAPYCYGHYGYRENGKALLQKHREQLLQWHRVVGEEMGKEQEEHPLLKVCMTRLLKEDPLLKRYGDLAANIRNRERGFMENSLRGMIGHHRQTAGA